MMREITTYRTGETRCPHCDHRIDNATSVAPLTQRTAPVRAPKEGDISVCHFCNKIGIYNEDHTIRKPTEEERLKLSTNPKLTQFQIIMAGQKPPLKR